MTSDKNVLAILIKSPTPAPVKTRLSPLLTRKSVNLLYHAFIKDILHQFSRFCHIKKVIAFSGERSFLNLFDLKSFDYIDQGEGPFGKRLRHVFQTLFLKGFSKVIIMSSDSPNLPPFFISKAFQMLKSKDIVIGPAWDGGYYLIGFNQAPDARFFEEISWSTHHVLLETVVQAKKLKKSIGFLPCWYDIDRPADLKFLSLDIQSSKMKQDIKNIFGTLKFLKMV